MRPLPFALLLSSLLLLTACGEKTAEEQKPEPAPVFQTQTLSELAVSVEYSAPATASSLNESTLKAEIAARIETIPARVGEAVNKGDVLVVLNCDDARAQQLQARASRDAAKARAQLAEQQLSRTQALSKKRAVSEELLSQRETEASAASAEVQSALAALSLANNQVERCQIRSPYNAIVTTRTGQVGELATLGAPMLSIVSTEGLEVAAEIVPSDADSLEQADSITFLSPSPYPVKLRALTAAVGSLTRTREARLSFVDQQPLPGTPGRLHWADARPGIPAQYLTERDGQLGVFIAKDESAHFVPLPHAQEGRAVATDLDADTPIITLGRHSAKDGQAISVDAEESEEGEDKEQPPAADADL